MTINTKTKPILFSGMQPTGILHLGNYLGALKNWVKLQDEYNSLFSVVDMHAITTQKHNPELLRLNSLKMIAFFIAGGVDPKKALIFKQSDIPQHAELCWILTCNTMLGWLNRMVQFKEKSSSFESKSIPAGILCYPILMASDILLYDAKYVPVGEDQKQHLELTRVIANSFNDKYSTEIFTLPKELILEKCSRVMNLRDGTKKMSKSDVSSNSRIEITDSNEDILHKIKKAKTDSILGFSNLQTRPEINNLINIYSELSDKSVELICEEFNARDMANFKLSLAELIINKLSPIREEYLKLSNDITYLQKVRKFGKNAVSLLAESKMKIIKECIGF